MNDLIMTNIETETLLKQIEMFMKSGLLPRSISKPDQAFFIAAKGRELGIPPLQALSQINIIQGKPTVSSELMMALISRAYPDAKINFEVTDEYAKVEATKKNGSSYTATFSMSDAKRAGLLSKDTWKNYPKAMLKARVISDMARTLFADAIAGCSYTPDEIEESPRPTVEEKPAMKVIEQPKVNPIEKINALAKEEIVKPVVQTEMAIAKKENSIAPRQELADYEVKFGSHIGKTLKEIDLAVLKKYRATVLKAADGGSLPKSMNMADVNEFLSYSDSFIKAASSHDV